MFTQKNVTMNFAQVITVFVSSTFNDMHAERDYIKDFVATRLQNHFSCIGVEIRFIDLRWGIITSNETDVANKEYHILKVCFDEIERSKPFFVGLIGERYGWVPGNERFCYLDSHVRRFIPDGNRSVTEMEMLFGALNDSDKMHRAVFCLRNPLTVDEKNKDQYIETSSDNIKRLRALRKRIQTEVPNENIITYSAIWKDGRVHGLKDFGESLYNVLERVISDSIDKDSVLSPNPAQQSVLTMREDLSRQLFLHNRTFVGRQAVLESISKKINEGKHIAIAGPRGCGKTSILAKITEKLSKNERLFPVFYSTTANSLSRRADIMLNYFCATCANKLGIPFSDLKRKISTANILGTYRANEESLVELESIFADMCKHLCQNGYQVVLIIDDIDDIDTSRYDNRWLFCPVGVPAVVTGAKNGADEYLEIGDLSLDDAMAMIASTSKWYCKEMFPSVQEEMIKHSNEAAEIERNHRPTKEPKEYNALWLSIALYYLVQFDADDYAAIHQTKADNNEERIEKYCLDLVKQLPTNPTDLFMSVVEKAGKRFGTLFVKRCVELLQLGRGGFRDSDFERVLGEDWNAVDFADFCRWMNPFITEDKRYHRWRLNRKWAEQPHDVVLQHKNIANMLYSLPKNDYLRTTELFYHALNAGMTSLCAELVVDSSAGDIVDIEPQLNSLSKQQLVNFCCAMIIDSPTKIRAELTGKIILSAIAEQSAKDPQMATQIVLSSLPYITNDCFNSSYDYSCMCEVLKDRIQFDKHFCSGQEFESLATALHNIALRWHQQYPCQGSETALSVVTMELSNYYMSKGDFDKAMIFLT